MTATDGGSLVPACPHDRQVRVGAHVVAGALSVTARVRTEPPDEAKRRLERENAELRRRAQVEHLPRNREDWDRGFP